MLLSGRRLLAAAGRRGRTSSFRRTWMTPGLSSHQLLDAGIAARQTAGRKDLKKSKRPFDNYFRSEFRCSTYAGARTSSDGRLSAYNAVRMMTDPTKSWETPWGRPVGVPQRRRKRKDARETTLVQFGADQMDALLERLVELRFVWDKEDAVVATALVPAALYARTEHCLPYSAEAEAAREAEEADECETIMVGGTPVKLSRPTRRGGHFKPKVCKKPKWGFTGVDTVPSMVADAARGPLLSSSSEPLLTLRWVAANRQAESVSEAVQALQQGVSGVSALALPPRSALLLLKCAATVELEDPALGVSLAIAMGENYHGYELTECVELLRCLRRLALMRAYASLPQPPSSDHVGSSSSSEGVSLYEDASHTQGLFAAYVRDTAPFLVQKVWSRLPEHSRHLMTHRLFLDWFDLMSLSVEMHDPLSLPAGLPNAASAAPYAAKYLYLRYTLGMEAAPMADMAAALTAQQSEGGDDDEDANRVCCMVQWLCASFLVRLVAEALGDVLRHVCASLQHHAAMAMESALAAAKSDSDSNADGCAQPPVSDSMADLEQYLDRLALPRHYPVGPYQLMGRLRPKRMRLRLLPYEAFPAISRCMPTPYAAVTRRATRRWEKRQSAAAAAVVVPAVAAAHDASSSALASASATTSTTPLESAFAKVLAGSPLVVKHVERATASLEWSAAILRAALSMVQPLPPPSPPLGTAPTPSAAAVSGSYKNDDAAAVRQALCERFVRSKVQQQMDSLFAFIHWSELETQLGSFFPTKAAAAASSMDDSTEKLGEGITNTSTTTTTGDGAAAEETAANGFLDMLSGSEANAGAKNNSSGTDICGAPPPPVFTEAELRAQELLKQLQERVEDFQVLVADLLDAHEAFFFASHDNNHE